MHTNQEDTRQWLSLTWIEHSFDYLHIGKNWVHPIVSYQKNGVEMEMGGVTILLGMEFCIFMPSLQSILWDEAKHSLITQGVSNE